ncbi:MAG: PID-CTERM protein-sorting domain-containing protein [Cyclonatronaceae bacterium]
MKDLFFAFLLVSSLLLLLFIPELLSAQTPPMFPDEPDQVPIDGGLGLLAAAGGAYALGKLRGSASEYGARERRL